MAIIEIAETTCELCHCEPTYAVLLPDGVFVGFNCWNYNGAKWADTPHEVLPDEEEQYYAEDDPDMAYERWLENGGNRSMQYMLEDEYERQLEANEEALYGIRRY